MVGSLERIVRWADGRVPGVPAFGVIPPNRPERFITIERTGGSRGRLMETPVFAVQVWAGSILDADSLAATLCGECQKLRRQAWVASLTVGSPYNFPDPDSGQARYQFTLEVGVMLAYLND